MLTLHPIICQKLEYMWSLLKKLNPRSQFIYIIIVSWKQILGSGTTRDLEQGWEPFLEQSGTLSCMRCDSSSRESEAGCKQSNSERYKKRKDLCAKNRMWTQWWSLIPAKPFNLNRILKLTQSFSKCVTCAAGMWRLTLLSLSSSQIQTKHKSHIDAILI